MTMQHHQHQHAQYHEPLVWMPSWRTGLIWLGATATAIIMSLVIF